MDDPNPRATAALAGQTTYQGNPCHKDHNGERYTRDGKCVHCVRDRVRARDAHFRELLERAQEAQASGETGDA